MTKVYRVELMVIDHDDLGAAAVHNLIQDVRYPNRCISPRVVEIRERHVEWDDAHPLNQVAWRTAFRALFTVVLAVLLVACGTPRPQAPYVHLVIANAPAAPIYLDAARVWAPLGFSFGFADSGRVECDRGWWKDPHPTCQITVGIVRMAMNGVTARSYRDQRRIEIERTLIDVYRLTLAVSHELGHVLLDTPEHTPTGIMSGGTVMLGDADRDLACRTIRRCVRSR